MPGLGERSPRRLDDDQTPARHPAAQDADHLHRELFDAAIRERGAARAAHPRGDLLDTDEARAVEGRSPPLLSAAQPATAHPTSPRSATPIPSQPAAGGALRRGRRCFLLERWDGEGSCRWALSFYRRHGGAILGRRRGTPDPAFVHPRATIPVPREGDRRNTSRGPRQRRPATLPFRALARASKSAG